MKTLKKIGYGYNKLEEYVLVISLVATVCIIFYQVIMRFIFHSAPDWTEEITRYIFIWQIWLGTSLGLKDREHIRITLISDALVKYKHYAAAHGLEILIMLIWLGLSIMLVVAGTDVCQQLIAKHAVSPGQRIPLVFVNAALPVSSAIVCIRLVIDIILEGKKMMLEAAGGAE